MNYIVELRNRTCYDGGCEDDWTFDDNNQNIVVSNIKAALDAVNEYWEEIIHVIWGSRHRFDMDCHHQCEEAEYYKTDDPDKAAKAASYYRILRSEKIPQQWRITRANRMEAPKDSEVYKRWLANREENRKAGERYRCKWSCECFSCFCSITNDEQSLVDAYDELKGLWDAFIESKWCEDDLPSAKPAHAAKRSLVLDVHGGERGRTVTCSLIVTAVGSPTDMTPRDLDYEEHTAKYQAWLNDEEAQAEHREQKEREAEMRTYMGESGLTSYAANDDGSYSMWRD